MHRQTTSFGRILLGRRGERGSTLLIVLALLSVLVLTTLTIAFTSRIEITAIDNANRAVQDRASALTATSALSAQLLQDLDGGPVSRVQLRAPGFQSAQLAAQRFANGTDDPTPRQKSGSRRLTGEVIATDLSGRINLNTADAATLERLFAAVAREQGNGEVNPRAIADAIVRWRRGEGRETPQRQGQLIARTQGDTLNESLRLAASRDEGRAAHRTANPRFGTSALFPSVAARKEALRPFLDGLVPEALTEPDPRLDPKANERRFDSVGQLVTAFGLPPRFVAAAEPHLTVFSVSVQGAIGQDGDFIAPVDLNRATFEEIFDVLVAFYGSSKDRDLLLQFALNIVDSRDSDSVPTTAPSQTTSGLTLFGLEKTPLITEVYARSVSDDRLGDKGEFIELFNPWSDDLDISGWRIRVGSTSHEFPSMRIRSGGFVIITDEFDGLRDPSREDQIPGTGSFYDIFGMTDNGTTRRILVFPSLDIPHNHGTHTVTLEDRNGNIIDQFDYRVRSEGSNTLASYQRQNIFLRQSTEAQAAPFSIPPQPEGTAAMVNAMQQLPINTPFLDVAEILQIGTIAPGSPQRGLRFPVIGAARYGTPAMAQAAEDFHRLDARVLELFVVEPFDRRPKQPRVNDRPMGHRHGLLNINTAGSIALEAAGFTPTQVAVILQRRRDAEQGLLEGSSVDGIAYRSLAEVLGDAVLFQEEQSFADRVRLASQLAGSVTVGSRAFLLEGRGRTEGTQQGTGRAGITIQKQVAFDGDAPEIVRWRYLQ